VLAALTRRRRTGRGAYIDLSQYETGLQFMAPAILDYFVNGHVPGRHGNRDRVAVPHGVYACRGTDRWVALSIWNDAEWKRFVEALGSPEWALNPTFATVHGRKTLEGCLDSHVAAWTQGRDREEAVATPRAHNLRAYAVNSMGDLFCDPQLRHRAHWRSVKHPVLGSVHVAEPPFLLRETPPEMERAAPLLGADNDYVLGEILGLTPKQIQELEGEGVLA
jgi:benzylsuccinate CoA-transferase BbsF subunit